MDASISVQEYATYFQVAAENWPELAVLVERFEQAGIRHLVTQTGATTTVRAYRDQGKSLLALDRECWLSSMVSEYEEREK